MAQLQSFLFYPNTASQLLDDIIKSGLIKAKANGDVTKASSIECGECTSPGTHIEYCFDSPTMYAEDDALP